MEAVTRDGRWLRAWLRCFFHRARRAPRGSWPRTGLQTISLGSGQGRTRVDVIAELLDVDIVTG